MDYKGLVELFQRRVSVRSYSDREVGDDDIKKLVEAARWAPTACNRQAWKVVITRKGTKPFELLAGANYGGAGFAKHAPVLLLVLVDLRSYSVPREMNYPVNDGSVVATYLMLAAASLGLDSCWVSWHASLRNKHRLYEELGIPAFFLPICVLSIGYRDRPVSSPPREEAEYYIHYMQAIGDSQ